MDKKQEKYSQLLLYSTMPATETAWAAGYEVALSEGTLDDNPYLSGDMEFLQWEEGWWSGFYQQDSDVEEANNTANINSKKKNNLLPNQFDNTIDLLSAI